MRLISPTFGNNEKMPKEYTCDGNNLSPHLEIEDVPEEAESLVLIADDPDAPGGTWVHWLLWNIPPAQTVIEEGGYPEGAIEGLNSAGSIGYSSPCPPSGTHRYIFTLYAIDKMLELPSDSDKEALLLEMDGHILAKTELVGLYERKT
ncbi:MAG TPA: YbhB/YbcL family Raf kinase inhibitor-like protein [bacterium]|nr:YbhB/YbcL family Raf kinase inhibitor-like protein [bacterium]